MTSPSFSIGEAIHFGWSNLKRRLGFFIGVGLVYAIFLLGLSLAQSATEDVRDLSGLLSLVAYVVQLLLVAGYLRITLRVLDGEEPQFSELFTYWSLIWKIAVSHVIYSVTIQTGLLLSIATAILIGPAAISIGTGALSNPSLAVLFVAALLLPLMLMVAGIGAGIFFGVRLALFAYFIVDAGSGPIDALKRSWKATRGVFWKLFLFGIVVGAINLVGIIFLLVGLLVTLPTTMIAASFVYRRLKARAEGPALGEQLSPQPVV